MFFCGRALVYLRYLCRTCCKHLKSESNHGWRECNGMFSAFVNIQNSETHRCIRSNRDRLAFRQRVRLFLGQCETWLYLWRCSFSHETTTVCSYHDRRDDYGHIFTQYVHGFYIAHCYITSHYGIKAHKKVRTKTLNKNSLDSFLQLWVEGQCHEMFDNFCFA